MKELYVQKHSLGCLHKTFILARIGLPNKIKSWHNVTVRSLRSNQTHLFFFYFFPQTISLLSYVHSMTVAVNRWQSNFVRPFLHNLLFSTNIEFLLFQIRAQTSNVNCKFYSRSNDNKINIVVLVDIKYTYI